MTYTVIEDPLDAGRWRVQAVDQAGLEHATAFSGPEADGRAREYAAWMKGSAMRHTTSVPRAHRGRMGNPEGRS